MNRYLSSNVIKLTVGSNETKAVVILKSLVSVLPRSGALLAE